MNGSQDALPQAADASATGRDGRLIRFVDRFLPRHVESAGEDKKRQVRTAIGFLMASWLMAVAFALSNIRQGFMTLAVIELSAAALLTWTIAMIPRTGRFVLFGNIGMSSGVATIFIACWVGDGLEAPAVVMIPLVPAWAYLGYGRRSALGWAILSVAGLFGLLVAERMGIMPSPVEDLQKVQTKRFIEATLGVSFGFMAARIFSDIKDYALGMLQQRTEELKEANARIGELFDSMRQGVLAFDGRGRVEGPASAQAARIFGVADPSGQSVVALLFGDDAGLVAERENFELWLEAAFAAHVSEWATLSDLAPKRIVRGAGTASEQHLILELRPVATDEGGVGRVMLLVTDETEVVRRELAAKARDDAHRREVIELRRLVAGGAHLLLRFLETARARFAEVAEVLRVDGDTAPHETDVAVAFQHVHTVRGEARTFQLAALEAVCMHMEDALAPLRAVGSAHRAADDAFRTRMRADLRQAGELLDEAEHHLVELSPIGEAVLDQITVRKSHLDEALALVQQSAPKGSPLARAMERLAARPFGESTQQLLDAVPLWAKRESKRVTLELEGRDALVPLRLSRVLGGVLTHLVRNAIAHGVELPSEREQAGKPSEAVVHLRCAKRGDVVVIRVEDDGRGIDEDAVRDEAERLGLPRDRPLDELLFEPGLSTCADVSEVAGRGMGMSAVRRELAAVGYQVRIHTTKGEGTHVELAPKAPSGTGMTGRPPPATRKSA